MDIMGGGQMKPITTFVGYEIPNGTQVGYCEAVLSPDGWENAQYHSENNGHLLPDEILEFSRLVNGFFHDYNTQNELKIFCKKYGEPIDSVTYGFRFDCALMTYCLHVTGYSAVFACYRRENV